MWRKGKPRENGGHNVLIFKFIPGLGGWKRLEQELYFYIQRPTIQGRKERREGRTEKGKKGERKRRKKNIKLHLNKPTGGVFCKERLRMSKKIYPPNFGSST